MHSRDNSIVRTFQRNPDPLVRARAARQIAAKATYDAVGILTTAIATDPSFLVRRVAAYLLGTRTIRRFALRVYPTLLRHINGDDQLSSICVRSLAKIILSCNEPTKGAFLRRFANSDETAQRKIARLAAEISNGRPSD